MTDFFNNPFPPGKFSITELVFTLSNVSLSNVLRFDFNCTTLTNETNLDNNNVTLIAKVLLKTDLNLRADHEPEQVSIIGDGSLGLSSVKNLDEFGMEVTHIYSVKFRENSFRISNFVFFFFKIGNTGRNNVRSHNVTIYWPYETLDEDRDNGQLLLYLVEEPILELASSSANTGMKIDGFCERAAQWRDHIRIVESFSRTNSIQRKRRDEQNDENVDSKTSSSTISTSSSLSVSPLRSLTLSCDPSISNVRCYPIHCYINSLSAQNYYNIKLRARLWNSTLIENYFDTYDRVDIQSFAMIQINDHLIFQTSIDNDNATVKEKLS